MDSQRIRDCFFAFFSERDHVRVASSSLVPNEPSLLLTNAGMIQFKPYFLAQQTPPFARAMSAQKCARLSGKHNDLEEVGKTNRHLTFFEMLGNFSFGDYYKDKACPWAWELVTERFGVDAGRLWVSVFESDEEAHSIWIDQVGVKAERVIRRGKRDNFWSMGVAGPCGPSSEIFVDLDPTLEEPPLGPDDDEDRYLEIWNLVFMQNDCNDAIEPVSELPKKNIDTGSGLERVAMVLQGVRSVFETDVLGGMVETASEVTGRSYGADDRTDVALRILADHGRTMAFLVADGVMPSNEDRGYVLRRIMRRAVRQARLLGHDDPVLAQLTNACVDLMGAAYPELLDRRDFIREVAAREEERFDATLKQGLGVLEAAIQKVRSSEQRVLPGDVAFRLHDTFGFPIDLTTEIASEAGLAVDSYGFEELMAEQRRRARAARTEASTEPSAQVLGGLLEERGTTEFIGYEHLRCTARVLGISDGVVSAPVAREGDEVDVVLDRTVFYARGGGQVGDRGEMRGASGRASVVDTRPLLSGLTGHRVKVVAGEIVVGDEVEAAVDSVFREGCQRAHTATHILHWTLRDRLGEHARQAGSLVEPGRLRFDFSHFEALAPGQVEDISHELQQRVIVDDDVRAYETSYDYARSLGAIAIFGEKYGDFVRVVEVGEYSKELCGGTHVPHTSQIGVVVVTGESSVGANLRRVEALVGSDGARFVERRLAVLGRAAAALRVAPDEVAERVERLLTLHKEMDRRLSDVERSSAEADASALAGTAVDVDGTRLVVARRDLEVEALRSLAQRLKSKLGSAVIVLGAARQGRANLVGAVTKDVVARGIAAPELLAPGAALLGGGAGGKPELAISGGPSVERLEEAIDAAAHTARELLTR